VTHPLDRSSLQRRRDWCESSSKVLCIKWVIRQYKT
jgi:hypothetical protein